jgi:tRNA pseudouridine55 synthase
LDGFLNILKPPGMSSHGVVKFLRECFPGVKIGHGGTLDPGAAGVLPVMLGKATRLSSCLMGFPKIYRAELYLGVTTDTADSYGKILLQRPIPQLGRDDLEKTLDSFTGKILQVPPMFSAIKKNGRKLYEYARKGVTIERKAREVNIFFIRILDYYPPQRLLLEVKCSMGTYIRTLCSDIGEALGCGGHMSFLLRKEVGKFTLEKSYTLKELQTLVKESHSSDSLLPLDYIFEHSEGMILDNFSIKLLCQGRPVALEAINQDLAPSLSSSAVDGNIFPIYTTSREFVALASWEKDKMSNYHLRPKKVFNTTAV